MDLMLKIWPELAWRLGVLALLILAPLARLALRRRRVLAAEGDGMLIAWFRYSRAYRIFFQGGWLVWAAVVYGLRLHDLLFLTLGDGAARNAALSALLALPPSLAFLAAHRLTRPVVRHVQGADPEAGAEEETLWDAVRFLVGSLWVVPCGVLTAMDVQERVGLRWWWLAGWFVAALLVNAGRKKAAAAPAPQALSTGELRDRIFELAGKAGITLNEIYVLPAARFRLANAYALEANRILLTDFLLAHFSRREVAAIAAHEIDHLRQKSRTPWALIGGCMGLFAAGIVLLVAVDAAEAVFRELESPTGPVWPVPFLLLAWVFPSRFHSRRQEMQADAGSARLTGDPEALISTLVRLSRLSLLPMRWSFLEELLSTPPSTVRRCEALAARFGVPPERLERLLAGEGIEETPEDAAADRFELPPAVLAPDRLFTTRVKGRAIRALAWAYFLPAVGLALGTAFFVRRSGLEGWAAWAAYLAALILATAVTAVAAERLSVLGYREVGDRLAARLESEGLAPAALGAAFAGFAPHGDIRLYEGHTVWDLGFLYPGADELVYAGDQVRFRIPRRDVLAVRPGLQRGFWLPVPDLRVDWRDAEGTVRHLRLRSAAGSLLVVRRATRLLGRRLEAWLAGGSGPELPEALRDLPLPPRSEVTSQPLRGSVTFRQLFFGCLLYSLVTLGIGIVLDLEIEALRAALAAGLFVPLQYLPHFLARRDGP
ncbi:MAG: M48 family metalloprotease [Acidobacteriota bacterium]